MPRRPRPDMPGSAALAQRSNDRQPCFFVDIDRMRHMRDLREPSMKLGVAVHAYVLMTNHAPLLLSSPRAGAIATLTRSLGRRYVRYINDQLRRTGSCRKEATSPAWFKAKPTCCAAIATSHSTQSRWRDRRPCGLPMVQPRLQRLGPSRCARPAAPALFHHRPCPGARSDVLPLRAGSHRPGRDRRHPPQPASPARAGR